MPRVLGLALPALVVGIVLAQLVAFRIIGVDSFADDTYISLTYARNLATGRGLVFNLGERVEGFTHPLWVLVEALVLFVKLPARQTLEALGVLAWLATMASAFLAAREARLRVALAWLAPLVTASTVSLAIWALSGMETMAHAALVAEGVRRFLRAERQGHPCSRSGALMFGVATLLRPDSLLAFAVCAALVFGRALEAHRVQPDAAGNYEQKRRRVAVDLLSGISAYLAVVLPWQVFRVVYYGEWLPNTYYAKVDPERWLSLERGMGYLLHAVSTGPLLVLLVGMVLGFRTRRFEVLLTGAVSVAHLGYVVWVGGDYMGYYRFIAPILAPLALGFAVGLERAPSPENGSPGSGRLGGLVTPVMAGLAVLAGFLSYVVPPRISEFRNATERFVPAAHWLAERATADTLVATPAVGAIGYFGRARVLDVFGLTDHYIARHLDPAVPLERVQRLAGHSRGNAHYVLSRRPDVIFIANVWVYKKALTPARFLEHLDLLSITDERLFAEEQFYSTYEVLNFSLPGERWLGVAVRKDSALHPDHPAFRGPPPLERPAQAASTNASRGGSVSTQSSP